MVYLCRWFTYDKMQIFRSYAKLQQGNINYYWFTILMGS